LCGLGEFRDFFLRQAERTAAIAQLYAEPGNEIGSRCSI
jgi:hypothetical protein